MTRRARGGLVWRLYLIGSLQIVLLGATVVGVAVLLRDLRHAQRHQVTYAAPTAGTGEPAVAPFRGPGRGPPSPVLPLLTFLFCGLAIVGVGSVLTARWIVRPLETLSRTARALGAGDLKARTGLTRQDELGDVGRSFDEMAERLQKLVVAEKELLANISHELRTPLSRIRVALDLVADLDAEAWQRLSMAEISTDLTELESLIDDVMTTARLAISEGPPSMSGFVLHVEDVAPATLCQSASQRFRTRHAKRKLELQVPDDLPPVSADPKLFRRVLDNLLDNADKYSHKPDSPVTLRGRALDGSVEFEVADQGMGIPSEDLPHVYEPFFRSEKSRSRGTGGVGLGLTLARRIVEAHGGTIAMTSTLGAGTTVRVSLPGSARG